MAMTFRVYLPDPAGQMFQRLLDLHPDRTRSEVMAMALCFYHALYETYLGGTCSEEIKTYFELIDKLADERRKQQQ